MKIFLKTLICLCLFSTQISFAQHEIIPAPVTYESTGGELILEKELGLNLISSNDLLVKYVEALKNDLKGLGIRLTAASDKETDIKVLTIGFELDSLTKTQIGSEGYQLKIDTTGIELLANADSGIFNGLQTLRQLLPVKNGGTTENGLSRLVIETCEITDYPSFSWRGLMLDSSRHFFTVEEIKAYLDQMAKYKLNVFHWHLTDDEGWRIEIKTFSKLTEVGAWRVERYGKFGAGRRQPKKSEKVSYGGFYSQEEIKDVVAYALERNITIVPEIDVPGHSMALLAAYPQFSTRKEYKHVNPGAKFVDWHEGGKFTMNIENMLNPADPAVYAFLDMVFTEVASLFPGEYIHMGGDECDHHYWDEDEKVKAFMLKNGINNSDELQSYFVKRVEKIISDKGKKMIGWDEILKGGLAEDAAVMSWRSMQGGIDAARGGHNVVMTPKSFTYLDYNQGDHSVENKIHANLSLERAYSFDPIPNPNLYVDVDPKYILGGQGNVWTEAIPTMEYAFYMTYPRAFAIAETLWSPKESRNWEQFLKRTEAHFMRFDDQNINIAKTIYEPKIKVYKDGNRLMCALKKSFDDIDIYYTIDNTSPVKFGVKYTEPFVIPQGDLSLRTQSFRNDESIGRLLQVHRKDLESRLKK